MKSSKLYKLMIEKLYFSIKLIRLGAVGFFISGLGTGLIGGLITGLGTSAANAQGQSNDADKEFWLWLEAYSDDRGNIMDPIDLSELASVSQNQNVYPADGSNNAQTKKPLSTSELANDLMSETDPQHIDASAENDEVHAQ